MQQHLLVQLHTYVSLALNKAMKFNLEDPLEKRFKKPSALNERLNGMLENTATESKPVQKDLSGITKYSEDSYTGLVQCSNYRNKSGMRMFGFFKVYKNKPLI